MKPTLLHTLSFLLLLLLFAFTTRLPLALSDFVEQVWYTNGNPIFSGSIFSILPANGPTGGGGLRLDKIGNSTCPLIVLQDYSEAVKGLPLLFNSLSGGFVIFAGITPLDIEFTDKPPCAESSKWVVVVDDDFPKPWVGIGGAADDHPAKKTLSGTFNVQKYGFSSYTLVFCSTGPPSVYYDIGRYDDEKGRRLILTHDDPFEIVFVDTHSTGSSTI